jgi:alkylation response protein AidB-like acyl-CoA dehydrogenase
MIETETRLSDEQAMFLESVDGLARHQIEPRAAQIDATGEIPPELYQLLVEVELLAVDAPLEQGGGGGDLSTVVLMLERLAVSSGAVAAVSGASHIYGAAWRAADTPDETRLAGVPHGHWGTLAEGIHAPIAATRTGHGLTLDGDADAVEAADLADALLVIGYTSDGDPLVCEVATQDVTWGAVQARTGLKGLSCRAAHLNSVNVSDDAVLGGARVLATLRSYRQLAAGACAVGIAGAALRKAVAYLSERHQFGRQLGEFPGLQAIVSEAQERLSAAAALLHHAALLHDSAPTRRAAAAQRACGAAGRMAVGVCSDAIQLHGGYGYTTEYGVERLMRDAISARARTLGALGPRYAEPRG